MAYLFETLKTANSAEAERHNDEWLGPNTLGIEVTSAVLAARCGLGNIDPQHSADGKSSAIEAVLECPLPPDGARIVTIRHDKDAVGAMAILALRAEGKADKIDKLLINWIGVLDRGTHQQAREQYPELAALFDRVPTDALNIIIKSGDKRWQTLHAKIRDVSRMLSGGMPRKEQEEVAALREQMRRAVPDFTDKVERRWGTQVAFIHAPGLYQEARNWGNFLYPVTVVFDPERHTEAGGVQERWTLVRQPGCFDREGFVEAINNAEAEARGVPVEELESRSLKWGGNKNIVSSPQGAGYGTALSKEQILSLVQEYAESGVVS